MAVATLCCYFLNVKYSNSSELLLRNYSLCGYGSVKPQSKDYIYHLMSRKCQPIHAKEEFLSQGDGNWTHFPKIVSETETFSKFKKYQGEHWIYCDLRLQIWQHCSGTDRKWDSFQKLSFGEIGTMRHITSFSAINFMK